MVRSGSKLKIGRTKNKKDRMRQAKTWLPDGEVVGIKPFRDHKNLENYLHLGLAQFWYKGEWYDFEGDEFEEWFIEEFAALDDTDVNANSINFIYLMNSTGMNEFTLEYSKGSSSKLGFQRDESGHSLRQIKK
ncbi:MAG: GIY-YIG nuclease family protein [Paracoccaceae bacterium]